MRQRESQEEETTVSQDVHTPDQPYCENLDCWCHSDATYHEQVIHPVVTDEEIEMAYRFLGLTVPLVLA